MKVKMIWVHDVEAKYGMIFKTFSFLAWLVKYLKKKNAINLNFHDCTIIQALFIKIHLNTSEQEKKR